MKWLALLTATFIIIGSGILWYAARTTPAQTTTPLQPLPYLNPYVDAPQSTHTARTTEPPPRADAPTPPPRRTADVAHGTRHSAPTPNTDTGQIDPDPGYDRRVLEQRFFDEVNRQRELRGLAPLELRKDLARTARKYSKELAAGAKAEPGYDPRTAVVELRHFGASFGMTVVERLRSKKVYDVARAGENILSLPLENSTYAADGTLLARSWRSVDDIVTDGVRTWMLSSAHRANILTPEYTHGGVGVFRLDNLLVVTEVFITKASCGYYKGPCCKTTDACFAGFYCDTSRDTPECHTEE